MYNKTLSSTPTCYTHCVTNLLDIYHLNLSYGDLQKVWRHTLNQHQLLVSVIISTVMFVCTNLISNNKNWVELLFMSQQILFEVLILFLFKEMHRGLSRKLDNIKTQCGSLQATQYHLKKELVNQNTRKKGENQETVFNKTSRVVMKSLENMGKMRTRDNNKTRPQPYNLKNDRKAFAPKNAKMNQTKNSFPKESDYVTMDRLKTKKVLKTNPVVETPEECVKKATEKKVLIVSATYVNPKEQLGTDAIVKQESKRENKLNKSVTASASVSVVETPTKESPKVSYDSTKSLGKPNSEAAPWLQ